MLRWVARAIASIFRVLSAVLFTLVVTNWLMGYLATGCSDGALRYYDCAIGSTDVSLAFTNLSWILILVTLLWIPVAIIYGSILVTRKFSIRGKEAR
jgi:hypothetical protein